jgi:VanZ family protein
VIAWGPAVLWALGLFLLSEIRGVPSELEPFLSIPDKPVHFILYLTLGGLLARARLVSGIDASHALLLGLGAAYAAIDEWHQGFVPGRNPDVADWLADIGGLLVGYWIIVAFLARRSGNQPHRDRA